MSFIRIIWIIMCMIYFILFSYSCNFKDNVDTIVMYVEYDNNEQYVNKIIYLRMRRGPYGSHLANWRNQEGESTSSLMKPSCTIFSLFICRIMVKTKREKQKHNCILTNRSCDFCLSVYLLAVSHFAGIFVWHWPNHWSLPNRKFV